MPPAASPSPTTAQNLAALSNPTHLLDGEPSENELSYAFHTRPRPAMAFQPTGVGVKKQRSSSGVSIDHSSSYHTITDGIQSSTPGKPHIYKIGHYLRAAKTFAVEKFFFSPPILDIKPSPRQHQPSSPPSFPSPPFAVSIGYQKQRDRRGIPPTHQTPTPYVSFLLNVPSQDFEFLIFSWAGLWRGGGKG